MGFTVLLFALAPHLGQDFFPSVDGGQIKMHVRAQTGTRIEFAPISGPEVRRDPGHHVE